MANVTVQKGKMTKDTGKVIIHFQAIILINHNSITEANIGQYYMYSALQLCSIAFSF